MNREQFWAETYLEVLHQHGWGYPDIAILEADKALEAFWERFDCDKYDRARRELRAKVAYYESALCIGEEVVALDRGAVAKAVNSRRIVEVLEENAELKRRLDNMEVT